MIPVKSKHAFKSDRDIIQKLLDSNEELMIALEKAEQFLSYGDNEEGRLKQRIRKILP